MKKNFLILVIALFLLFPPISKAINDEYEISYQSHVQNIGWQKSVNNGNISGTTGQSLRLEAFQINVESNFVGNVLYSSYVEGIGWQDYVGEDQISGTTGQSKKIEAIKIKLTEELEQNYDIYYSVHVSNVGWMDWAKNDEKAGYVGYGQQIEAIKIILQSKEEIFKYSTEKYYQEKTIDVSYKTHVQNLRWLNFSEDDEIIGTTKKGLRMEAFSINLSSVLNGNIYYSSYVEGIGWQDYVGKDQISGTTGQSKKIEAIKIKLDGELEQNYNVYYSVHVSNVGWMDWAKNDEKAGYVGYGEQVEAIKIKFVKKDEINAFPSENVYKEKPLELLYSSHIQDIGWQDQVSNGMISGTEKQSKRLEAISIKFNKYVEGGIKYSTHVSEIGWTDYKLSGEISGTTGQSKRIEAIKIELTGDVSLLYDVYYRVHVQNVGWMDWAKNGELSGTTRAFLRIEAIQIILVEKGSLPPGSTEIPYREGRWETRDDGNRYYYDIYGNLAIGTILIGDQKHHFGPTGIYLGTGEVKVIDVSHHQGYIDWNQVAKSGIYGVILRIGYWNIEDLRFREYISEVKRLGIPYGIYIFSYALNGNDALLESNFTNSIISKYSLNPTLGIFYDLESWTSGSDNSDVITPSMYDEIARVFINNTSSYVNYKYKVKIYANLYFTNVRLGTYALSQVDWIAQYNNYCSYTGKYSMWQYSSTERIPGINTFVDMSVLYH